MGQPSISISGPAWGHVPEVHVPLTALASGAVLGYPLVPESLKEVPP